MAGAGVASGLGRHAARAADVDVSQYWVSEKFDGARAQWDGRSLRFPRYFRAREDF